MLTIRSTAIYFGSFLTVPTREEKCNSGSEFGLAHFLGDFDVGGIELSVAVGLECAEKVSDNLFLPIKKLKAFTRPGAFGVAEALDKVDRIVGCVFIVDGVLGFELGRGIFLFCYGGRLLSKGIKKQPYGCREEQSLTALSQGYVISFRFLALLTNRRTLANGHC